MSKDEALRMAIEALEDANYVISQEWSIEGEYDEAINACKEALGELKLAGALDRVRITTVNGTDTFDAGSINILYE